MSTISVNISYAALAIFSEHLLQSSHSAINKINHTSHAKTGADPEVLEDWG